MIYLLNEIGQLAYVHSFSHFVFEDRWGWVCFPG